MNRLIQGLALGLASSGLLLASAVPAAAQPGGPCTLAPDVAVTQALGNSARAFEAISIPDLHTCGVEIDGSEPMTIMHITASEQSLLDDIGPIPSGGAPVDVQTEPADGFGYSAMFVRIPVDGETALSLRVQVGDNDVYAFLTQDAADAPARLSALARAVLPH